MHTYRIRPLACYRSLPLLVLYWQLTGQPAGATLKIATAAQSGYMRLVWTPSALIRWRNFFSATEYLKSSEVSLIVPCMLFYIQYEYKLLHTPSRYRFGCSCGMFCCVDLCISGLTDSCLPFQQVSILIVAWLDRLFAGRSAAITPHLVSFKNQSR